MTHHATFPTQTAPLDMPLDGIGIEIVHCAEDGSPSHRDVRALARFLDPLLRRARPDALSRF